MSKCSIHPEAGNEYPINDLRIHWKMASYLWEANTLVRGRTLMMLPLLDRVEEGRA